MSETATPQDSHEKPKEPEYPPWAKRILLWIGAMTAVLVALTGLTGAGRSFLSSISGFFAPSSEISKAVPCSPELSWDEKIKCEKQQH